MVNSNSLTAVAIKTVKIVEVQEVRRSYSNAGRDRLKRPSSAPVADDIMIMLILHPIGSKLFVEIYLIPFSREDFFFY